MWSVLTWAHVHISYPGCELYAFCGALFGICSMMTLMVIAVDRYVVITRPLASLGVMSRKKAFTTVAVAWLYSMGWSLPPFFGWSEYNFIQWPGRLSVWYSDIVFESLSSYLFPTDLTNGSISISWWKVWHYFKEILVCLFSMEKNEHFTWIIKTLDGYDSGTVLLRLCSLTRFMVPHLHLFV